MDSNNEYARKFIRDKAQEYDVPEEDAEIIYQTAQTYGELYRKLSNLAAKIRRESLGF